MTLRLELATGPQAPSQARAAIAEFSAQREIGPAILATLTLLVSELVTNAVVHPQVEPPAAIRLFARISDQTIRVEVTDRGGGFTPRPRDHDRPEGGYGLYLVQQQASHWGVDRQDGTTVWFELAA